jgi:alpha-L-fucosidase
MKIYQFMVVFVLFSHVCVAQENYLSPVRVGNEPVAGGKFKPTWQSLQQ